MVLRLLPSVEVNIAPGTKYFVVGLADVVIKESYFRIESPLKNCGYRMPRQQVVVNMAPADIKKGGSAYDLTIATGVLAASGQIETEKLDKYLIMGELSLNGGLQPIKGALPIAIQARKEKYKGFSFMLIASMNPCPCGYYNHPEKDCICPPGTVQKYLSKISGPLLDRIDLHVDKSA